MIGTDYELASRLKAEGMPLKEIMQKLHYTGQYKAFQKALFRYEKRGAKHDIDIKPKLLKLMAKETSVESICKAVNQSERVIRAYIEDLKNEGYNILNINGNVMLAKAVLPEENTHTRDWNGEKVIKFGVVSDTHIGNKWQQQTFLNRLYDIFEQEGIKTVYHAGDISDGYYKTRPGHIYELIEGLAESDAQAEYIISNYPKRKGITTEFITGNHDDTHIMNGGANIGKAIARGRQDMVYLGCNNARVYLTPNCILELNHPGDGSAYALSYTLQKLIDSMSGGEKPNILINGHHHKAMYLFYRNIHAFEAGTTEAQTPFMKGKKIAAHVGGWIITVHVDEQGTINRCNGEFIPLYKPIEKDY